MSWAALIPIMAQTAGTIAGAASSRRSAGRETMTQEQANALEASRVYEEAALNPASPHFRALQALQEAEIKRNVLQAIDLLQRRQKRDRARGVLKGMMGGLPNPERRDESFASAIGDLFAKSGDEARRSTTQTLQSASTSARERAGGFGSINNLLRGYADTNNANLQRSIQGLTKTFEVPEVQDALSKIFGGTAPQVNFAELLQSGAFDPTFGSTSGKTQFGAGPDYAG